MHVKIKIDSKNPYVPREIAFEANDDAKPLEVLNQAAKEMERRGLKYVFGTVYIVDDNGNETEIGGVGGGFLAF